MKKDKILIKFVSKTKILRRNNFVSPNLFHYNELFGVNAVNGKLPAKTLTLWRVRATVVFLLLYGVFAPFLRLFLCVGVPLYLAAVLWYIPKLHKSFFVEITENKAYLKYGALFERHKLLLLKEKAVVLSVSTPFCRMMRLESIAIKTASGWFLLPETERDRWNQNV